MQMIQVASSFIVTPRPLNIPFLGVVRGMVSDGSYWNVDPMLQLVSRVHIHRPFRGQLTVQHLCVQTERNGFGTKALSKCLERGGYRLGTAEELLGYGADHQQPLEYPLIALGSKVEVEGENKPYAMVITPYNISGQTQLGRSIGLVPYEPDGGEKRKGWIPWWKFLAVKISEPQQAFSRDKSGGAE